MAFLKDYLITIFKKLQQLNLLFIFSLCCLLAYFFMPRPYRGQLLNLRKYTAVLELAILIYLLSHIKKISRHYQLLQQQFNDPPFNIRDSITHVMGSRMLFRLLITELVMLGYGLKFWGKEKLPLANCTVYTVHKESGYLTVWIALVTVTAIETVGMHFLLLKWSYYAAITMTILSVYGLFFFISDLNGMIKKAVLLNDATLVLRMGFRWRCIIPLENIRTIVRINEGHPEKGTYSGAVLKSSANLLITFYQPVSIDVFFKTTVAARCIIFNVDQPEALIGQLNQIKCTAA